MFSTRNRITGFSGFDVDTTVRQLIHAESSRLHRMQRTHISTTWRQEALRGVNTSFRNFQNRFLNLAGGTSGNIAMQLPSAYSSFNVNSTGATNGASVVARADATPGRHSVSVISTASPVSVTSQQREIRGSDFDRVRDSLLAGHAFTVDMPNRPVATVNMDTLRPFLDAEGVSFPDGSNSPTDADDITQDRLEAAMNNLFASVLGSEIREGVSANEVATNHPNAEPVARVRVSFGDDGERMQFSTNTGNRFTVRSGIGIEVGDNERPGSNPNALSHQFGLVEGVSNVTAPTSTLASLGLGIDPNDTNQPRHMVINGREISLVTPMILSNGETQTNDDGETVYRTKTVNELMGAINNAGAGVTMRFDNITNTFSLESNAMGSNASITFGADPDANPYVPSANAGAILSAIFGASSQTVIDYGTGEFDNTPETDFAYTNLFTAENMRGSDAIIAISSNGGPERVLINQSGNTIVDELTGLVITANQSTVNRVPVQNPETGEIQYEVDDIDTIELDVVRDNETVFERIRDMINAYNELLDELNGMVNERPARSDRFTRFEPLLEFEREALGDREIEQMEERAREGILNRNPLVNQAISWLRESFITPVNLGDGRTISLMEIGISTSSDWTQGGRLEIDESRLRAALDERPDDVAQLFARSPRSSEDPYGALTHNLVWNQGNGVTAQDVLHSQGFAQRLNTVFELMANNTSGIISRHAGGEATDINTVMRRDLDNQQERINRMIDILRRREDDHFRRFNAMEAAMVRAESQMATLMSQLAF